MSFGNSGFPSRMVVPKGLRENSPAFQRREEGRRFLVPQGRLNPALRPHYFSRPCGTGSAVGLVPALKRRAILIVSLRDNFPPIFGKNKELRRARNVLLFRSLAIRKLLPVQRDTF